MCKKMVAAFLLVGLLPLGAFAKDRSDISLTVQQNGRSLVQEQRSLDVPKGAGTLTLTRLPVTIEPETLQITSKTSSGGLKVLDATFEEELLTPSSLLRRHLGKNVLLRIPDGNTRDGRVQKTATVLSVDEAPLFLIDGNVYSGPYESIVFPEVPKQLSPAPRLLVGVDNSGPARQDVDLTYLVRELSWNMDYVLSVNKDATNGQLSGWARITNKTGVDYANARVELLAGEPRALQQNLMRGGYAAPAMVMEKSFDAAASEELFEYHLYTIARPVTLNNQQTRQIKFIQTAGFPVTRQLLGKANALPSGRDDGPIAEPVDAILSFRNSGEQGLGQPLPKGTIRVYQADGPRKHLLGEAPLDRTAAGATAEMKIGKAFDITIERVPTGYEKTGAHSVRCSWEIRIRNSKNKPQKLTLQEVIPGKWSIQNASHPYTKKSKSIAEFAITLPPGADKDPVLLTYTLATDL